MSRTDMPVQESRKREQGFSLLELLVAMMIIAVLGTLGFTQFRKHSAHARWIKSGENMKIVSDGLDQYYLKHGSFPEFGSFDAMVENNSPLVKESLIPTNMSAQDMFGQPFEGKSTRGNYELKFAGDPNDQDDNPPVSRTPGNVSGGAGNPGGNKSGGDKGGDKGAAPTGGEGAGK